MLFQETKMFLRMSLLLVILIGAAAVQAQDACPALAEAAIATALTACDSVEQGQICFAHPTLQTTPDLNLSEPGDAASISDLEALQPAPLTEDGWGLARIRLLAGDTPVLMVPFGAVRLTAGTVQVIGDTLTVTANNGLNVRSGPSTNDPVSSGLAANQTVVADGRLEDESWLHIQEPDGWVLAELVSTEGTIADLSVIVDPTAPLYQPLQAFEIETGVDETDCTGYSGLLLQSPLEDGAASLIINDHTIKVAGTIYIQAGDVFDIQALEGLAQVILPERSVAMPAGTRLRIEMSGAAGDLLVYDEVAVAQLPLELLDRSFALAEAPSAADIANLLTCSVVTSQNVNLREGPGTVYPLRGTLVVNEGVAVIGQAVGTDEIVWWQLAGDTWVRSDVVTTQGNCDIVPEAEAIPPTPVSAPDTAGRPADVTYAIHNCTANGSMTSGQVVNFYMGAGGWATRDEARQNLDGLTGSITVDGSPIVVAFSTRQWGENNYGIQVTGNWLATSGTHQVNATFSAFGGTSGSCTLNVS
jgi:uncharacterized protein YraI